MREKLSLGLVALVCVAVFAGGAMSAEVFFSDVGVVGGGVAPVDALTIPLGEPSTIYIWASADQNYSTSIGMNVLSGTPGVVAFSAADVIEPDLFSNVLGGVPSFPLPGSRWQRGAGASVGAITADSVSAMNATNVTDGTGILVTNNGVSGADNALGLLDNGYDVDAGAFLLGSVTVDPIAAGTTVLSINQDGTALFVNAGAQVDPNFGTLALTAGVPEPSTLVLVAFGLIAMLGYGLKR